jgi:NADH-quinone oxidoreductase subunit N
MDTEQLQLAPPLAADQLAYLAPELTLVISAVILAMLGLFTPRKGNGTQHGGLAIASLILAAGFVLWQMNQLGAGSEEGAVIELLNGSYRIDAFAVLMKLVLLAGTALVLGMSLGNIRRAEIPATEEYYYLYLPAVLGAMIMVSSNDLITLFVGLELLSITSYVLAGIRKRSLQSAEGAFKYVVIGGISTAFTLYGMSFLYGMTGTTHIGQIREMLEISVDQFDSLLYVSFLLLFTGLAVKIAAAPFHAWAPDVYQGAATPVTAFLAVVSKGAGLAVIFRLVLHAYNGLYGMETNVSRDLSAAMLAIAAAAMIIGNLAALKQENIKRLLALSGVANAGYLLVPMGIALGETAPYSGLQQFLYYFIAYMFMTIGAFSASMLVGKAAGHDQLNGFAGLYYRAPWTAAAMLILLLSLAGIPVTGGFFGKLFILWGAVEAKAYWISLILILTSVISYFYYFKIVKQMFMRGTEEAKIDVSPSLGWTIWICAAFTVIMGIYPGGTLRIIESVLTAAQDVLAF